MTGYLFFFCKQKSAYGMRISDWSSDVCSSDLLCAYPHRWPIRIWATVSFRHNHIIIPSNPLPVHRRFLRSKCCEGVQQVKIRVWGGDDGWWYRRHLRSLLLRLLEHRRRNHEQDVRCILQDRKSVV